MRALIRRGAVLLLSLGVLLLLARPGTAGTTDDALSASKYFARLFIVTCAFSHASSDDPIGKPGQSGASHRHDFFGNTSTDAASTLPSMLRAGTTCNRSGDTAGYWMPSVLEDGTPLRPGIATFYYRAPGVDPGAVTVFPPGFKMVAGDAEAMTPQPLRVVEWSCRSEGAKKPWRAGIPQCGPGSALAFRSNFPDCWNGRDLDSANHRSHVAYSDNQARCPSGFPVRIPEISMTVTYPGQHDGVLSLATHSPFGGHADFFNTWQPTALADLVHGCLHADRECSTFYGPGGAEPITPVSSPGAAVPVATAALSQVSPVAGDFAQHSAISADGTRVAFEQHSAGRSDVLVRAGDGAAQTVSVARGGTPADGDSYAPTMSANGRLVAFSSDATNLVPNDTNGVRDVFVRDLRTGTTTRLTGAGGQPDGPSTSPRLSADGRFLAFTSFAANLVPGDSNRQPDVFRVTLATRAVQPVSVAAGGDLGDRASAAPDISADGRFVAFGSWARGLTADDTNRWSDVFVRDMTAGRTELASRTDRGGQVDNSSYAPSVSDDGRLVAFESAGTNIVTGDKGARDVFVRDLPSARTYRVSGHTYQRVEGDSMAADLSGDGSTVVFASANRRLAGNGGAAADVYSARPDGSGVRLVSARGDQPSGFPSVSRDGRAVAFESTSGTLAGGTTRGRLHVYRALLAPR